MTIIIGELCGQIPPRPYQMPGSGYYPAGVRDLPGEEPPTYVVCPECGYDYELYDDGAPRECDNCGHIFDGSEETR